MSEQEWAAIVYGRTYHLDFRFITLPDNFDSQDAQWALSYITATTQQARNLAGSPRWSLFKNDAYCVVGVTCMVRDLIKPASSDLLSITKDDQGRPLYVFVGYVTQLKQQKKLTNFPPYGENCLDDFRDLYQEIAQVWLVKNYEEDKIKTSLSDYQRFSWKKSEILPDKQQIKFLNHYLKSPEQTHLWSSLPQQNSLLWQFSARCSLATATCLNINGKALSNSPFLNQSCSQVEQFQIKPRLAAVSLDNSISLDSSKTNSSPGLPLSQQIKFLNHYLKSPEQTHLWSS
ncbi:MAG: hypothetical protein AAFN00_01375, partial [Cyanobacteria bacterium J06558_2]